MISPEVFSDGCADSRFRFTEKYVLKTFISRLITTEIHRHGVQHGLGPNLELRRSEG